MEEARGQAREGVGSRDDLGEAHVEDLIRFMGWVRAFHVIGFCYVWVQLDGRPIREVQKEFEARGISKSTAYRLMGFLLDWIADVERREGRAEGSLSPEIIARRLVSATTGR